MSWLYKEKYVHHSQKSRKCAGCDNHRTILIGDPYYSCFYADGSYAVGYSMCVLCKEHVDNCEGCSEAWYEGEPSYIREHRLRSENERVG